MRIAEIEGVKVDESGPAPSAAHESACAAGWHVAHESEYYYGASLLDEETVRCSVTRDGETGEYSVEESHPWHCSAWCDG